MANANPPPDSKRDLLFGALALQLNFVGRDDLRLALREWGAARARPLAQVLVEQKALPPRRRSLLDELTREYLSMHGMDAERGFAAACAARPAGLDMAELAGQARVADVATLASPSTLQGVGDGVPVARPVPPSALRYRVVRPHARGALGEVFVAMDEELNREVALKEIQEPYANSPDSRARFLLEAEITGSLEHPGIVPVYSLGTHMDGRPFYAMRFIKGESLHEAITRFHGEDGPGRDPSARALEMRALLSRFVGVCQAIGYAHARGVIHRDIKPSNVMLGPYGETLVVDWGLAKAFDQPMTPDSVEFPVHPLSSGSTQATILGQAVGTPAYMSPEQAHGRVDQVGPASDVYALGATLFNLLTGVPPFNGRATDVLHLVKKHAFLPPRRVKREVPAALDAVVLKAMAFDPNDRYPSATALAEDVERWLADEPVAAHREPAWERARRWTRRHRPAVYAAAALVLTALVGLVGGLYVVNGERARTKHQAEIAEENFTLAKKAIRECFVIATEHPLLQQRRMREVRKVLLGKAMEFYGEGRFYLTEDYADSKFRVARIAEEVGTREQAAKAYEVAREVFERLAKEQPDDEGVRANLGRVLNNLGTLQRDEQAKATLEAALALREKLASSHPGNNDYQRELADTYNNLGELMMRLDNADEARKLFAAARRLLEKEPGNERYQAALAAIFHNEGNLLAQLPDSAAEARKALGEALTIRGRLARLNPANADYRADAGSTHLSLATLYDLEGQTAAASKEAAKAAELFESLAKEDRDAFQADLARALLLRGRLVAAEPGQFDEGVALLKRAIGILDAGQPDADEARLALANAHVTMGWTLRLRQERAAEARGHFDKALALLAEAEKATPNHPELTLRLLRARWGRGEVLAVRLGEPAKGLKDLDAALGMVSPADPTFHLIRHDRAFALAHAGRHREAADLAEELMRVAADKGERKADLVYNMACVYALSAKAASPTDAKRTKAYVDRVIDLLSKAQNAGFFAKEANRKHFAEEKDFDFLRPREDFKNFVNQLPK